MNLLNRLLAALLGFSSAVLEPLVPILKSRAGRIISAGVPLAIDLVVQAAQQRSWTGEQKRSYVTRAVGNLLITEGIAAGAEISTSLLNTIAELALTRARQEKRIP